VAALLYGHGDVATPVDGTIKVLDEILSDFIINLSLESYLPASIAGRQKVKLDDVKFACRKNPKFLGKIQENIEKKEEIEKARKMADANDDKIMKGGFQQSKEEELGEGDDDIETATVGGKSTGTGRGK
jgi:transcription initiation factor TFIID subunit 13